MSKHKKWKREQERLRGFGDVKIVSTMPPKKTANVYISNAEQLAMELSKTFNAERERNRESSTLHSFGVSTRVPSKYRLIDLETGDVWRWDSIARRYRATSDIMVVVGKQVLEKHDCNEQQENGPSDEPVHNGPEASSVGSTQESCACASS